MNSYDSNGRPHGYWVYRNPVNNEITSSGTYIHGSREGFWEGFVNGVRRELLRYKDGALNGRSNFYMHTGILESIEEFKDGKFHGLSKSFDYIGRIRGLDYYENNVQEGEEIRLNCLGL